MENEIIKPEIQKDPREKNYILKGIFLLLVGGAIIAKQKGLPLPEWLFTWQAFLVVLGIYLAIKNNFRDRAWLVLILVGVIFSLNDPITFSLNGFALGLIVVGLVIIFTRGKGFPWSLSNRWRKKYAARSQKYSDTYTANYTSEEDYIDIVSVLGGTKKNILSKDFKGGEAISFFGGTELNLSQADINGRVLLDLTQVFGGTKLIVPPHWNIKSELVSVFGSVDDKRGIDNVIIDENKILVLKGTSIFGGIDIRSY
jgi:Cell wall-active antibiotics response 4TMS YvqF